MKLTTKNLLIILVVLASTFAVTQLTKRSGRSKSLKSELITMDTAKVSKIDIIFTEGSVTLSKSDEGWKVSLVDGTLKQAKQSAVSNLLSSLNAIRPGRLAAKSQNKWKDYAVDSAGTRVKVYEGSELNTDIVIGRFGVEGQQSFYTFVRLFEDEEVYVAPNFMGVSVGKDAASYRENTLLRLNKDSLSSISFNYPDTSFNLINSKQWYLKDQPVDSASVATYLSDLSFVSSREFYDDELTQSPLYKVVLSFSNQPDILLEGFLVDDEIVVRSSENKNELFNDKTLVDKIFMGKSAFPPTSE